MEKKFGFKALLASTTLGLSALPAAADQVFADDLIVQGSACIGIDCNNGESFGFDTLRLKENNLRLHFDDTSVSASFPRNDWRLVANETSNGGLNVFRIEDATAARSPFSIEAGASANALYVDSNSDVGLGTSNPVVELHVVDGDSPTLRLEQDGSSGFTPQTFDLAANETNFFVRDVSNGSQLPFRIKPGSGNDDAIVIAANGDVGMGTDTPSEALHVRSSAAESLKIVMEKTSAAAGTWEFVVRNSDGEFAINNPDSPGADYIFRRSDAASPGLQVAGNVTVSGTFISNGTTLNVPDYVFQPEYELMPLAQVRAFIDEHSHLPSVPSAADVKAGGLNLTDMQLTLLKKVEELTLYTLEQEDKIAALEQRLLASD